MSEKINDGGPAFPVPSICNANGDTQYGTGGSRQHVNQVGGQYAGTESGHRTAREPGAEGPPVRETGARPETAIADSVADLAFEIADAMLRRSTR